jgi:hypothetical protein
MRPHEKGAHTACALPRIGRTAPLLGCFLALAVPACESDIVCPGHIDPSGRPAATIRVADASASIAAVEVAEGPCAATLLDGWADGSMVVASAYVSLRGDAGDRCLIHVLASDGRCEVVTISTTSIPASTSSPPHYHCLDNSNCCVKSAIVPVAPQPYSTLAPYETDISFRDNPCPGHDGGAASVDGSVLDVSGVDGGTIDRAID